MAYPGASPRLVLSRGVHILLPLTAAGAGSALLIPHTEDGRVIFAIPWLDRLLVGTTDQEVTDNREADVSRSEAEYLLRHLNRYLRQPRTTSEIVSAFSGVRPMVRAAHARQTKRLIRDHEVEVDPQVGAGERPGRQVDYVPRHGRGCGQPRSEQLLGNPVDPELNRAVDPLAGATSFFPGLRGRIGC